MQCSEKRRKEEKRACRGLLRLAPALNCSFVTQKIHTQASDEGRPGRSCLFASVPAGTVHDNRKEQGKGRSKRKRWHSNTARGSRDGGTRQEVHCQSCSAAQCLWSSGARVDCAVRSRRPGPLSAGRTARALTSTLLARRRSLTRRSTMSGVAIR